jgi:hypothetical protein
MGDVDVECSTCQHWLAINGKYGECRAEPPKLHAELLLLHDRGATGLPTPEQVALSTRFPVTERTKDCGQWEERYEPEPPPESESGPGT